MWCWPTAFLLRWCHTIPDADLFHPLNIWKVVLTDGLVLVSNARCRHYDWYSKYGTVICLMILIHFLSWLFVIRRCWWACGSHWVNSHQWQLFLLSATQALKPSVLKKTKRYELSKHCRFVLSLSQLNVKDRTDSILGKHILFELSASGGFHRLGRQKRRSVQFIEVLQLAWRVGNDLWVEIN